MNFGLSRKNVRGRGEIIPADDEVGALDVVKKHEPVAFAVDREAKIGCRAVCLYVILEEQRTAVAERGQLCDAAGKALAAARSPMFRNNLPEIIFSDDWRLFQTSDQQQLKEDR